MTNTDPTNGNGTDSQSQLWKALLGSVVRHGVTVIATYFVSKGILLPGQEGSFIDLLSGAGVIALMLAWSFLQKFAKHAEIVGIKQAFADYVWQVQQTQGQGKSANALPLAPKLQ